MANTERWAGIFTFVAAARASSFSEAADLLGVTRSSVGKSIARLEQRLGAKLFHRTTRKISLTADGEAYLAACTNALDEIASAETALNPGSLQPTGRLKMDMPVAFGRQMILPVLLQIGRQYPDLLFTLVFTDAVSDLVEDGVDLAIRFGSVTESGGLVARPLARQRLVICASPAYLERYGTPKSLDELSGHYCIVNHRRGRALAWRIGTEAQAQRFTPTQIHQVNDGSAMVDATVAGLGICQMPMSLFKQHIASGAVAPILADISQTFVEVNLVWPKTAHLRPKIRYVVDELVRLSEEGVFD